MGFTPNTVLQAVLWQYYPDPTTDPTGVEVYINIFNILYVNIAPNASRVFIYFTVQGNPLILEGKVATAFANDYRNLFH